MMRMSMDELLTAYKARQTHPGVPDLMLNAAKDYKSFARLLLPALEEGPPPWREGMVACLEELRKPHPDVFFLLTQNASEALAAAAKASPELAPRTERLLEAVGAGKDDEAALQTLNALISNVADQDGGSSRRPAKKALKRPVEKKAAAKKAPAKKAPAKKAPAKKAAAKKAPAKKAAAKKAPAKKAGAKKAGAKKAPARRPAAKKAVKKAPARKAAGRGRSR